MARHGDPAEAIAAFEREASAPLLRIARPEVIATPSWLLIRWGAAMELLSLDDVAWVHGAKDNVGVFIAGAFQLAGAIDNKTRREFANEPADDLVFYRRSNGRRETLPVDTALGPILEHFVRHRPETVVGFAPVLLEAWESDRARFIQAAATASRLSVMQPDTVADDVDTLFAFRNLAESAVGVVRKSVDAFAPDAKLEQVIAPVKASVDLGKTLVADGKAAEAKASKAP